MKNSCFVLALLPFFSANIVFAQTSTGTATPVSPVRSTMSAPTAFHVVERGANHKVWQSETYEQGSNGKTVTHIHSYTELGTGLHYWQGGQWLESQEQIRVLADGSAAATRGQHQVTFPADIYQGTIGLSTPDGVQLQSQPVGLSYDDGKQTVFIAVLKDSTGQLAITNQLVYPNAFSGVKADLQYTYRKSGFEQDVVLRQQPPSPASLGLNPVTTRLQVVTEFFNTPDPAQDANVSAITDVSLKFGQMQMIQGKAFTINPTKQPGEPLLSLAQQKLQTVPVGKSWVHVNGRTFLIEEVVLQQINAQLSALPLTARLAAPSAASVLCKVSKSRLLPPTHLAQTGTNRIQLAQSSFNQNPGVVLDYLTLIANQTNFTFQGDATYYVSGEYNLLGTTIFEGGTVIKMNGSGQIDLDHNGSVVCQTAAYRPAIFTSLNDDSVGEALPGSSGTPVLGDANIFLNVNSTNLTVHDMRFSYYWFGINQNPLPATLGVWNCQFTYGDIAIYGGNVGVHNVLIARSLNEGDGAVDFQGTTLIAENVTADFGFGFFEAENPYGTASLTNCLVTQQPLKTVYSEPVTIQTNTTVCLPTPSIPVYQTIGAGSYYLTNGSPYHSLGTTNISPSLLAELNQKTTYPPIVFSNLTFSVVTNFSPQAPRDTNATLDLGYHYDPLDYVFGGCDLYTNLTFTAGTAVGLFENNGDFWMPIAITLNDGANLTSIGTATQPCWVVRTAAVQEGGNGNWTTWSWMSPLPFTGSGATPIPQLNGQFTKSSSLANVNGNFQDAWAFGVANFNNSEFYGGNIASYQSYQFFTNCLFVRVMVSFWDQNDAPNLTFQNCTFYNGGLALCRYSGQSPSFWNINNTTFDGTDLIATDYNIGDTNYMSFDYNAYNLGNTNWQSYNFGVGNPNTNMLEVVGPNDVTVTNGYNWQSSWLGNFYLPTVSPLIDAGSTNANLLGLYHFTTQTNQMKEANTIVDIGYHYVAADAYGNPIDSNSDGIPDYIEDANGNGITDFGEVPFGITIDNPLNGSMF
jgi:hypothetical protein